MALRLSRFIAMINNFIKRLLFILILTPALCVGVEYQYEEDPVDDGLIVELRDFKAAIKLSGELKRPLMLEFSTPWCEYCEALEEQVIKPMIDNDIYADKIIIRKLEVDDATLINAQGKAQTGVDFAIEHDVDLYPTLVFFNGNGKEISNRIVGITTLDYVGEHVDQAIKLARQQMKLSF